MQSRRRFIATVAAAGAAIPFTSGLTSPLTVNHSANFPLRLFSKPLDGYDFDFICECAVGSGIGGLDLTVRPGGKVEPADVETSLPKLIERARKHKLTIDMIVT